MAVVVNVFNTVPGQVWASGTTSAGLLSTDPAFKVDTQLTSWIAAINNPAWIQKRASTTNPIRYGTATDSSYACWDLIMNEGETEQYGLQFLDRPRTSGAPFTTYLRRLNWTDGTDSLVGSTSSLSSSNWSMASAGTHFIAYEGAGDTPWFLYAYKQSSASLTSFAQILARVSVSGIVAGSYYPASGLGKWVTALLYGTTTYFVTPQFRFINPYYGVWDATEMMLTTPGYTGYFFNMPAFYGDTHFLGQATNDILISSDSTGSWGDTVTIGGINYTALKTNSKIWWVKTSN